MCDGRTPDGSSGESTMKHTQALLVLTGSLVTLSISATALGDNSGSKASRAKATPPKAAPAEPAATGGVVGGVVADESSDSGSSNAKATVTVRSAEPGLVVGYITGRAFAAASNGATIGAVMWKDVCTAPCSFQLPVGFQEIVAHGPGYVGASQEVDLQAGDNARFVVRPGSAAVRIGGWVLTTLGLTAAITAATFAAIGTTSIDSSGNVTHSTPGWAIPTLIAGGLGTAGGITMIVLSSTSINREGEAEPTASSGRYVGVSYSGKF
jgi:hypothetical protein